MGWKTTGVYLAHRIRGILRQQRPLTPCPLFDTRSCHKSDFVKPSQQEPTSVPCPYALPHYLAPAGVPTRVLATWASVVIYTEEHHAHVHVLPWEKALSPWLREINFSARACLLYEVFTSVDLARTDFFEFGLQDGLECLRQDWLDYGLMEAISSTYFNGVDEFEMERVYPVASIGKGDRFLSIYLTWKGQHMILNVHNELKDLYVRLPKTTAGISSCGEQYLKVRRLTGYLQSTLEAHDLAELTYTAGQHPLRLKACKTYFAALLAVVLSFSIYAKLTFCNLAARVCLLPSSLFRSRVHLFLMTEEVSSGKCGHDQHLMGPTSALSSAAH